MSSHTTLQMVFVLSALELHLQFLSYLVTFPKCFGHLQSLHGGFNYTFDHQGILRTTLPGLTHLRVKRVQALSSKLLLLVASGAA